jgi:hypothetical protein
MTYYAIIQKDYAVFGTGTTEEEAVKDCKEWINSDDEKQQWDASDFPTSYNSANEGDFVLIECTKAVHTAAQEGESIAFDVTNNIADIY